MIVVLIVVVSVIVGRTTPQKNLAPDGTPSQSSTLRNIGPELAIEGPESTTWEIGGEYKCSHTDQNQQIAWWMDDLGSIVFITIVKIYYREYYAHLMDGFSLYVTNSSAITNQGPDGHLCYADTEDGLPALIQDIDCYATGRYVIFFNDNRSETGAYVMLCYIEIHGCSVGTYGPHCNDNCPRNCAGPCHPDSGNCVYGCSDGWLGDKCDQACNHGFFGSRCQSSCSSNCLFSPCDHETGTCRDEKCDKGWKSLNCSTACSHGYFEENCDHHCKTCFNSSCDRYDGICTYGCIAGYDGNRCQIYLLDSSQTGYSIGFLIGCFVGGILIGFLIALGATFFIRRHRQKTEKDVAKNKDKGSFCEATYDIVSPNTTPSYTEMSKMENIYDQIQTTFTGDL